MTRQSNVWSNVQGDFYMKIKICGLRREEDINYVNQYRPDFIGFVFAEKSKRRVTREEAVNLRKLLDKEIIPVGVFVNEEIPRIAECVEAGAIDVVQLHGDEDSGFVEALRSRLPGTKIIRAIRVATEEDVLKGREIPADYLLFDTFQAGQVGGTGQCFDWSVLKVLQESDKPYFLAGGITPDNLPRALRLSENPGKMPYALDVSSGVETEGFKDKEKIAKLMGFVRK